MYGGHITDDWDRRLCVSYLEELMQPDLIDGELQLAPGNLTGVQNSRMLFICEYHYYKRSVMFRGFPAPPNTDLVGYHAYIDEAIPPESPYLYGLHPNAEIGFLTMTAENLFKTVFEMQPRDTGSSGGQTVTREDKVIRFFNPFRTGLFKEKFLFEIIIFYCTKNLFWYGKYQNN